MEYVVDGVLLAVSLATVVGLVLVLRWRAGRWEILLGVLALVLVLVGWGLVWVPDYVTHGVTCQIDPTTSVLGFSGSAEAIAEVSTPEEQQATRLCIDLARQVTAGAAALIVVPAVVFGAVAWTGRRRRRLPQRRPMP